MCGDNYDDCYFTTHHIIHVLDTPTELLNKILWKNEIQIYDFIQW